MKSSFGGFQAAFLNFMPKRDAEVITEAPPTIDDLPNCKRKNVEQITPPQSLKKPKVSENLLKLYILQYVSHAHLLPT
jgi:hypothetical protein